MFRQSVQSLFSGLTNTTKFLNLPQHRCRTFAANPRQHSRPVRREYGHRSRPEFRDRLRSVSRQTRVSAGSLHRGVMAFSQLKFDTEMVRIVTSFLVGGAALAFRVSIGLGSRDIVRNLLAGFYVRRFFQLGKSLKIGGQRGIARGHCHAYHSGAGPSGHQFVKRNLP